jgi:catalase
MQGIDFVTQEDSAEYSPDFSQKDLYEAIQNGDYPKWSLEVQTMTPKEAEELWEKQKINVFDLTHVWPQKQFPRRKVGEFTLNENAINYFAEIEQIAFNPAHLVPGIEPSADPVLQSRLFSYPDTHRHRIGVNYQQLPVNATRTAYKSGNFQRDGQMAFFSQGARPNYLSSIDPIKFRARTWRRHTVTSPVKPSHSLPQSGQRTLTPLVPCGEMFLMSLLVSASSTMSQVR